MVKQNRFEILRNWNSIEQISYGLVWIILWFLPLIFWDISDPYQYKRIVGGWIRILPYFVIFLIHNTVFLPHFLMKKKYTAYFLLTLGTILLVNYFFVVNDALHQFFYNLIEGRRESLNGTNELLERGKENHQHQGMRGPSKGGRGPKYWRWHIPVGYMFTYNVFISILIVGFNALVKFTTKWLGKEQERKEAEKEAVKSQLTALQKQVSPHFFMNTLNNIHALIDYNKDDAKDAVLRLSKMMRYLLYESEQGKTSLKKEIEFLESYIDLMKLRLQPSVDLKVDLPTEVPAIEVYSLLTISFVENAFKHGIDPRKKSFIHILMEVNAEMIHFNVKNSKLQERQEIGVQGGIGIENAQQRLDLLFGEDYHLNIYNRPDEFEVDLNFPIL